MNNNNNNIAKTRVRYNHVVNKHIIYHIAGNFSEFKVCCSLCLFVCLFVASEPVSSGVASFSSSGSSRTNH